MRAVLFKVVLVLFLSTFASVGSAARSEPMSRFFAETGFTVADYSQTHFLSEFQRLGGADALGYPASNPYQVDGFHYQVFQRAILQWRPELGRAVLANTLDWLSDQGKDGWLNSLGIPERLADSGGSWERVVAEHEGWLTNPEIARAYRNGGGIERFGLPQSRPERRGSFIVQRFQRAALQFWLDQGANTPSPGTVVGVLSGDIAKQAGIVPSQALIPDSQNPSVGARAGDSAGASIIANPEAEQFAISLINQSRKNLGLPPVVMDSSLQRLARAFAADMAARNFFSHTDPDGRGFADRLKTWGIQNWTLALENLGYGNGYKTPLDSVRANHEMMMAQTPPDDRHRRNIINERARKVGIGVVQRASDGRVYYVTNYTD